MVLERPLQESIMLPDQNLFTYKDHYSAGCTLLGLKIIEMQMLTYGNVYFSFELWAVWN